MEVSHVVAGLNKTPPIAHLACTVKARYIPARHSVTFHTQTPLAKPTSHNIHQARSGSAPRPPQVKTLAVLI